MLLIAEVSLFHGIEAQVQAEAETISLGAPEYPRPKDKMRIPVMRPSDEISVTTAFNPAPVVSGVFKLASTLASRTAVMKLLTEQPAEVPASILMLEMCPTPAPLMPPTSGLWQALPLHMPLLGLTSVAVVLRS